MILGLALLVIPVIAIEESQLEPHWKNLADVGTCQFSAREQSQRNER